MSSTIFHNLDWVEVSWAEGLPSSLRQVAASSQAGVKVLTEPSSFYAHVAKIGLKSNTAGESSSSRVTIKVEPNSHAVSAGTLSSNVKNLEKASGEPATSTSGDGQDNSATTTTSQTTEGTTETSETTEGSTGTSETTEESMGTSKTTEGSTGTSVTSEGSTNTPETTESPVGTSQATEGPMGTSKTTEGSTGTSVTSEGSTNTPETTDSPVGTSQTTEGPTETSVTTEGNGDGDMLMTYGELLNVVFNGRQGSYSPNSGTQALPSVADVESHDAPVAKASSDSKENGKGSSEDSKNLGVIYTMKR